jgi:D-arabinose 1-dehydrogenase-like Zn-dependent alcohol dehydrogenase
MKAMVIDACGGPEKIRLAEVSKPDVGREDVLIQVKACSLNHMDLFVRQGPAEPEKKFPFWGLADVAGGVSEVGAGLDACRTSDRAIVNPALSCGACGSCRSGEDSLCVDFQILGDEFPGGGGELALLSAS